LDRGTSRLHSCRRRLIEEAIRILDELGRNGYEMATRGGDADSKLLSKKAAAANSGTVGTYSARNRT
jgi:hypothetical protein